MTDLSVWLVLLADLGLLILCKSHNGSIMALVFIAFILTGLILMKYLVNRRMIRNRMLAVLRILVNFLLD